jgi:hypothetical protein
MYTHCMHALQRYTIQQFDSAQHRRLCRCLHCGCATVELQFAYMMCAMTNTKFYMRLYYAVRCRLKSRLQFASQDQDESYDSSSCCAVAISSTGNSCDTINNDINNSGTTNYNDNDSIIDSSDSHHDKTHDNSHSSSVASDTTVHSDVVGSSSTTRCTSPLALTPAVMFDFLSKHQQRTNYYKLLSYDPAAAACRAMVRNQADIYVHIYIL